MNFKHLHYFWVTAKAGGVMRAGEQLHTTPQTLSGQIHLLEEWLGRKLFKKSGRNLELTEDGRLALGYADQIFALGSELESAVRAARGGAKVLDALEEILGRALPEARDVLRDFGNMSAPTVLFVLDRLRRDWNGRILMTALGPGFTAGFLALGPA